MKHYVFSIMNSFAFLCGLCNLKRISTHAMRFAAAQQQPSSKSHAWTNIYVVFICVLFIYTMHIIETIVIPAHLRWYLRDTDERHITLT